jgi:hypothetical protein
MISDGMSLTLMTTVPVPAMVPATVSRVDGATVHVTLDRDVAVGARVIVELPAGSSVPRATAVVRSQQGRAVVLQIERMVPREAREYPRLMGRIPLRYRPAGDEAAWMRGDDIPGIDREPDALMSFSVTGLAFDDIDGVRVDDRLLLAFSVPGSAVWRAVGRVVRVAPIPADEREPDGAATCRVAIAFESIPVEATKALLAYTTRMQDEL